MTLTTTYLATLSAGIAHYFDLGNTPSGVRRYAVVGEGTFEGPRISAKVLPGGSDSLLCTSDDARRPDVRFLVETHDGAASALHVAAAWGRADVVRLLLNSGADPNTDATRPS